MSSRVAVTPCLGVLLLSLVCPANGQGPATENTGMNGTAPIVPLRVGNDVTAPRAIYAPDPEYSQEARSAHHQGTCVLSLTVDPEGKPQNITIKRPLGMGLDQKAIEAVRMWTFDPARKNGKPVAVQIDVEVSFRLIKDDEMTLPPELLEWQRQRGIELAQLQHDLIYPVSGGYGPRQCQLSATGNHPAVVIAQITFDGDLTMTSADQQQISSSIIHNEYFGDLDSVTSGVLERVRTAWQEHGYLRVQVRGDAQILSSNTVGERVAFTIHLDEGQQYQLSGITFKGNRALTNIQALRDLFPIADGGIFDREKIAKGLDSLRKAYAQFGYANFVSVPQTTIDEENRAIALNIDCDEGKQFYVSRINIVGLDEPTFKKVREELFIMPAAIYNERLASMLLEKHAELVPGDTSSDPRLNLRFDEDAGTVAITYDFRRCVDQ
jgi:TonB family protein